MRISLCLVVWNELEGCGIDVPLLPKGFFDEVYAVDGGSSDGTVEYLKSQGIPVYKQPKKGLNAAYIHAREKSTCDATIVFFPKGTIAPASLKDFRQRLEEGYDLVIASRNIKGAHNEEDDRPLRPRKWFVECLALLAATLWRREGNMVWDVLHGVKAFTNSAFDKMNILDHGLSIDIEMAARAYRLRIPRCEIPVKETARLHGGTHFAPWSTGKKLIKYLAWEIFRNNNEGENE